MKVVEPVRSPKEFQPSFGPWHRNGRTLGVIARAIVFLSVVIHAGTQESDGVNCCWRPYAYRYWRTIRLCMFLAVLSSAMSAIGCLGLPG